MRIMIAEDELLERKAMKKFIEHHCQSMKVIAEAQNGRQAIQLAEEMHPDLILMDIKMPGINGLEAIEAIYQMNPLTRFILLSAYDSFNYAKKAMKFGIKDYILKPGKKDEIIQSLRRVEQELLNEQKRQQQDKKTIKLLQQRFLKGLKEHPLSADMGQLQQRLFPNWRSSTFIVIQTAKPIDVQPVVERTLKVESVMEVEDGFLIVCLISDELLGKKDLLVMARNIQGPGIESIGLGSIEQKLEKMPDSYQSAYQACLQHKKGNKRPYGFYNEEPAVHGRTEKQEHIYLEVEKGNVNQSVSMMKQYQSQLTAEEFERLYIQVINLLHAKRIQLDTTIFSFDNASHDWCAFMKLCAMKLNHYYQSQKHTEQMEQYIKQHFKERLTLSDVAGAIGLSPSYFSNLFKEEFHITFTDYVGQLKMMEAKRLITENTLSMKEISFHLGYKDPNYFSRVFKKYYHESPQYFKKEILK